MKLIHLSLIIVVFCLATDVSQAEEPSPVLLIVQAWLKPDTKDTATEYQAAFGPLAAAAGGKPVARYTALQSLRDDTPPDYIAVLSFPSADAVRGLFASDESKALDPLRQRLFEKVTLWISPQS
jgi:uncharacterized protein (DUF1330 family)